MASVLHTVRSVQLSQSEVAARWTAPTKHTLSDIDVELLNLLSVFSLYSRSFASIRGWSVEDAFAKPGF